MIKTYLGPSEREVDCPDPIFIDRKPLLTFQHCTNCSQEQKDKAARTLERMLTHLFCLIKPERQLYQRGLAGKQGFNCLGRVPLFAVNEGICSRSKQDIMRRGCSVVYLGIKASQGIQSPAP